MYKRFQSKILYQALEDTPVILLAGARQTGKSTLIQEIIKNKYPARYVNLDDLNLLSAAQDNPVGFIDSLGERVALDEIQRAPQLFLPIKKSVDENRAPGRFLLTGSANVMTLPKITESLAGRIEIRTLWPLSQGEIRDIESDFLNHVFSDKFSIKISSRLTWEELAEILVAGGFPEAIERKQIHRRDAWFQAYLNSIIQRDVKFLSNIENLRDLPRLLTLVASRSANLLNFSDLSRSIGVPQTTLKRYFALLENVFLLFLLPAWFPNKNKQVMKSPKIYMNDTGLLCHLLHLDAESLLKHKTESGSVLENFVALEVMKQASWNNFSINLHHFRDFSGHEVDLVLERSDRKLVGIEIKSSQTVVSQDFKGLKALKHLASNRFHRGLILYLGHDVIPFAEDFWAVPLQSLWELSPA